MKFLLLTSLVHGCNCLLASHLFLLVVRLALIEHPTLILRQELASWRRDLVVQLWTFRWRVVHWPSQKSFVYLRCLRSLPACTNSWCEQVTRVSQFLRVVVNHFRGTIRW